jgi:hypothetical protein
MDSRVAPLETQTRDGFLFQLLLPLNVIDLPLRIKEKRCSLLLIDQPGRRQLRPD